MPICGCERDKVTPKREIVSKIEREREREKYIYIYIERENKREGCKYIP